MIAIGIDPGASCGVAAVSRDWVAWTTVTLPSWRGYDDPIAAWMDHGNVMFSAVADVLATLSGRCDQVPVIAVEDSRHARGMQHAAMTGWHLALAASTACLWMPMDAERLTTVAPSTWQHGLVGAQGRDEYVRYARELTGGVLAEAEHDAAAAICIAEWAWHRENKM